MYKQQAKSTHIELCRWIMHRAVARIQTTGMPPLPPPPLMYGPDPHPPGEVARGGRWQGGIPVV